MEPVGQGNEFVITTIRMVNDQTREIDTNAFLWDHEVGGISYRTSMYVTMSYVNYSYVSIGQGGDLIFQVLYEVPANLEDGKVECKGLNADVLRRHPAADITYKRREGKGVKRRKRVSRF